MQRLDTEQADFSSRLAQLTEWHTELGREVSATVEQILADVASRGDAALLEYTERFDRLPAASVAELEIPASRLAQALDAIDDGHREALEFAAQRIRSYHQHQVQQSWDYRDNSGNLLGQKITPLERAGIYVPGGKASYPSSVLMNALPAKVAGVGEIVMVVPSPAGELS